MKIKLILAIYKLAVCYAEYRLKLPKGMFSSAIDGKNEGCEEE